MGNITGNPFNPGVVKQINERQAFMGANPKQDQHLIYQNNKTAFLRLASSIKIEGYDINNPDDPNIQILNQTSEEILSERGISKLYTGNDLAKAAVLFGGIVDTRNNQLPQLNYGLKEVFDENNPFNGAYGWGGIKSQGYRPMPGIISANVSYYNRGSLAKAEVKCKVYSIEQLQVFDLLYFRIGYSMLLEWGHNIYIDNKGELQQRTLFYTDAFNEFFTDKPDQDKILAAIKSERLKSSYNYDAMLGKVTNFTWKFNEDGSYDVELKLVGYGDVIESLKINTSRGGQPAQLAAQTDNNIKNLQKTIDNISKELQALPSSLKLSFLSISNDPVSLGDQLTKINQLWAQYTNPSGVPISSVGNETFNFSLSDSNIANNLILARVAPNFNKDSDFYKAYVKIITGTIPPDIFALIQIKGGVVVSPGRPGGYDFFGPSYTSSPVNATLSKYAGTDKGIEYFKSLVQRALSAAQQIKTLENKKVGDQSLPEVAKEYADTTEFHRQLYRWIENIQSGNYDVEDLYVINYAVQSNSEGGSSTSVVSRNQYYVRLGTLLEWIEDNLLVYDDTKTVLKKRKVYPEVTTTDKTGKQTVKKDYKTYTIQELDFPVPLFKIDTENGPVTVEKETDAYGNEIEVSRGNFCLRFDIQVSADPSVCLIPMKKEFKNVAVGNQNTNATKPVKGKTVPKVQSINGWSFFQQSPFDKYIDPENPDVGRIMNVFINIDFLANKLQSLVDKNGKVNLLKLLQTLCTSINDALGNVNKLEPVYDGETNTLKIIEESKLQVKGKENDSSKIAVFEVYGVKSGVKGSFVTNVDFQVQLPPNMAAMATISAQSKGTIVGENATGLSKLNKGLVDRVITRKLDAGTLGLPQKGGADDPEVILNEKLIAMTKYLDQLYREKKFSKANVDTLKSINRDVASYFTGIAAEKEQIPAPFFIPFNLSLDMDGLSGMVNYQRFAVNEAILPYSYRPATNNNPKGVIDFLIKGISHEISQNKWKTKIESLTVSSKRTVPIAAPQQQSTTNKSGFVDGYNPSSVLLTGQ
jgi:hypothetical protein